MVHAKVRGALPLKQFTWVQLGFNGKFGEDADAAFFCLVGPDRRLNLQIDAGNSWGLCLRARDGWARAFAHLLGAINSG
eukprot:CAMPEP_0119543478 /NCGR_PEP_ID=MMETSP1344-20130328/54142_1 /TAXON_ID=236787 /ORGANISM="Florenciella parvula, Strain CCMP2471" /LENGTH=78 /DNA_ID=CAMNT_0007587771 /DNA_START=94 /DNA_END=328 /DNA_ORIENTATION=-